MSVKIKVKKRINENSQQKWDGWKMLYEEDATATQTTPATQQQTNTNTQPADNGSQQQSANTQAQAGPDINKFMKEVQDFYIKICTQLKEACQPEAMKKDIPTYVVMKETEPFKGKEQAFAKAVNDFTTIDPKEYQKAMPAFSKIIEEMGKYVSACAQLAAPGEKAQAVTQQPAPAQTQGQQVTTTTAAPTATATQTTPTAQQQPTTGTAQPAAQQ